MVERFKHAVKNIRITKRNIILAGGLLAIFGIPATHPQTTMDVVTAISGGKVDCADKAEPNDSWSLVITDGGDMKFGAKTRPNSTTQRSLIAAAEYYIDRLQHNDPPEQIWLLDDVDSYKVNRNFFQELVDRKSDHTISAPDHEFSFINTFNTSTAVAAFTKEFFAQAEKGRVTAFTGSASANRLATLMCARNIPTTVHWSEEDLILNHPDQASSLRALLNSPAMQKKILLEKFKLLPLPWDWNTDGDYLTTAKRARNFIRTNPFTNWTAQK